MLHFRDQLIAASLKRQASRADTGPARFPRSADRGLIEACHSSGVTGSAAPDFRDQLIAASLKPQPSCGGSHEGGYFRDQLIAASLKRKGSKRYRGNRGYFRDQLIAASLKHSQPLRSAPPCQISAIS